MESKGGKSPDRPFRKSRQAGKDEKQPPLVRAAEVDLDPAPHCKHHEECQRHVDLAYPCLPEDLARAEEGSKSEPGGSAVEEPRSDQDHECRGRGAAEGRRQGGCHLVHATAQPSDERNRPEVERRLLVVEAPSEMRDDELPGHEHLVCHLGVARLVRIPQVTQSDSRQQRDQRYDTGKKDLEPPAAVSWRITRGQHLRSSSARPAAATGFSSRQETRLIDPR